MSGYGWHPPSNCRGNFKWVGSQCGSIPRNAVKVGVDKDGTTIFAGRAFCQGDLLPAKVVPSHNCAYVSWGGEEITRQEYEVLCSAHVAWIPCSGGNIPPECIGVGSTSNGETLYLGRTVHEGTLTPGKIHCSHGKLYIPYGGKEVGYSDYEAMVLL